ncbi:MAG: sodium:solute symporter family protein [Pseudomonadota bacterium]
MTATLHLLDWLIIGAYVVFVLVLGAWYARRAGQGVDTFFVGQRDLPWWLAGTSIVATTFAADTPLAVTGIVATGGIAGNWLWWSWAIAHLTSTFFFARLWRRSGVITDAEITELRYGGRPAAVLRAVKALYFGLFINCLTMAWVIKAMVKISQAFFDVPALLVIVLCVTVAVAYTVLGGFHSVVASDLVQFALGMAGAIVLAVLVVDDMGGLGNPAGGSGSGLLPALDRSLRAGGQELQDVLAFAPGLDHPTTPFVLFVVLLFVGWWRYAEGNGYIVQRLAACKNEGHAQGAALWFSIAHNALRPWPWILVGLAALVIYPQLSLTPPAALILEGPGTQVTVRPGSLDLIRGGELVVEGAPPGSLIRVLDQQHPLREDASGHQVALFGGFSTSAISTVVVEDTASGQRWQGEGLAVQLADRELAYPLIMGRFLPVGLLGLVIASLLAAFMSTIDTHTNWGASYLVRDVYQRFIHPGVDEQRAVLVSRLCIVGMAAVAGGAALVIESIAAVWTFLIMIGAGLGSVSAVRWYWSRVTPHAEFAALIVTTVLALGLQLFCTPTLFGGHNPLFLVEVSGWLQLLLVAGASLAAWIPVSLWGPRNDDAVLRGFARRVRPPGPGWAGLREAPSDPLRPMAWRFVAGAVAVFGALFGLGELILGTTWTGAVLLALAALALGWIVASERSTPGREGAS